MDWHWQLAVPPRPPRLRNKVLIFDRNSVEAAINNYFSVVVFFSDEIAFMHMISIKSSLL
jgi:hypothetical protein